MEKGKFKSDEESYDLRTILEDVEKKRIPIENKYTYICSSLLFLMAFMIVGIR